MKDQFIIRRSEQYSSEDWVVRCPVCADEYSHIREAGTLMGGDEGQIYPVTQVVGITSERRSALQITFDGECGHAWVLVIQQHKGVNFVQIATVPHINTTDLPF